MVSKHLFVLIWDAAYCSVAAKMPVASRLNKFVVTAFLMGARSEKKTYYAILEYVGAVTSNVGRI